MERLCLRCGEKLVGRSDKRFCSTQCKSEYNNLRKSEKEREILNTNKILRKNRTILKKLSPTGKTTVRKEVLEELGFDFQYFTTYFTTQNGQYYYFSYDYGFSPIIQTGIKRALIVTHQNYMGGKIKLWEV